MTRANWLAWGEEIPVTSVNQIGFDREFEEYTIKKVRDERTGFDIALSSGWSIWVVKEESPVRPHVGDCIRLYGKGIGYSVRGIAINGNIVRYVSEEEDTLQMKLGFAQQRRNDAVRQWETRDEILDRIQALPPRLRDRMNGFERDEPGFLLTSDAMYELFIYEEAVKFAKSLETIEALNTWKELDYNEQKELVDMSDDHSGNTFGAACAFAKWLLEEEEVPI